MTTRKVRAAQAALAGVIAFTAAFAARDGFAASASSTAQSTSNTKGKAGDPTASIAFEKFKLANGLTVILHSDRSLPLVAVNVWYHVGPANEPPHRSGFAHLFEHLMFEGSKHVGR